MQPYVNQFRSFTGPLWSISQSAEKPSSISQDDGLKIMSESQYSSIYSSDKESSLLTDRAILVQGRFTEAKLLKGNPEVACNSECGQSCASNASTVVAKTDTGLYSSRKHKRSSASLIFNQLPRSEAKQSKTANNILIALNEGKAREINSPVRSRRTKVNTLPDHKPNLEPLIRSSRTCNGSPEVPSDESNKNSNDSTNIMLTSYMLKHAVSSTFELIFNGIVSYLL